MGNVKALPTRANDEQPWQCTVCGAVMAYSQPINFRLCMELGKLFTDWHEEHCKSGASDGSLRRQDACENCGATDWDAMKPGVCCNICADEEEEFDS